MSATGAVAFWAITEGPTATSAIFLWTSASGIVPLLAVGDVLVPGGAIRSFRRDVVINGLPGEFVEGILQLAGSGREAAP